ncbi:MAG: helix-turn-helix domain-containing protein [Anaerolineales bacterium]|nr:helix-turn-helix domain-containing protein [Anaerolineales bacterium]
MFAKLTDKFFGPDQGEMPNKFTRAMGKLIRAARQEANLTQEVLAKLIYKRQAAVSDMENGKVEPSASTLLLLCHALNKPLGYFFPQNMWKVEINEDELDSEEQELILHARRLSRYSNESELTKLIAQVRALADFAENQAVKEFNENLFREMSKD